MLARAALICLLMLSGDAEANFDGRALGVVWLSRIERVAEHTTYKSAEFCGVYRSIVEPVLIGDRSPDVEKLLVSLHLSKIAVIEMGVARADGLTSANERVSRWPLKREIKVRWDRSVPEFKIEIDFGVDGRSGARIFNNRSDVVPNFSVLFSGLGVGFLSPEPRKVRHTHIGPLANDQRSFCDFRRCFGGLRALLSGCDRLFRVDGLLSGIGSDQFHLPLASLVEVVSGAPQQDGRHNQRERKPADEKPLMAIHKSDEGFRKTKSTAGDEWWVLGVFAYMLIPIVAPLSGGRWDWVVRVWVCSLGLGGLFAMFGLI